LNRKDAKNAKMIIEVVAGAEEALAGKLGRRKDGMPGGEQPGEL
jgi:hypothetical protein